MDGGNPRTSGGSVATRSPLETLLPRLSAQQASELAYPPDFYPGARDVTTPLGIMRVYEFGLEDGRKVLLIHGDTTPSPVFSPIARSLARRGCRVMTYDLWGRGYSDAPYDVPFDTRLFTTQILFALTSSPLSWTGRASRCFSVIGFSLGGGIAMAFAALFPQMLRSLVLLAPSGILRRVPADYMGDIIRAPASSAYDLRVAVGKLLGVQQDSSRDDSEQVAHEAQGPPEGPEPSTVDVQAVIQWQYDCCAGFVDSFVRTIRHGPLMGQQVDWIRVGQVLTGHEPNGGLPQGPLPLAGRKILMIFGAADSIVPCTEVVEDFESLCPGVGKHLEVRLVPGGHGFPVPGADSVVEHIAQFWALPDGRLYTP